MLSLAFAMLLFFISTDIVVEGGECWFGTHCTRSMDNCSNCQSGEVFCCQCNGAWENYWCSSKYYSAAAQDENVDAAYAAEQLEIEELRDDVESLMKDATDDEGKTCAAHSDCPSDVPFCYDGQYGGECDLCSECQFCQDGIDGTCGNCGSGYPTIEEGKCQKRKKCAAHSDCPPDLPFCYADESGGECDLCSECQFCQDGVDGTCGNCGSGYPTIEEGKCQKRDAAEQRSNYAAASEVSEDLVDSFNEADINGDGKLSFEELTDVEDTPDNRAIFAAIDADGDGYITIGDVSQYVSASRAGDDDLGLCWWILGCRKCKKPTNKEYPTSTECTKSKPFCFGGKCQKTASCKGQKYHENRCPEKTPICWNSPLGEFCAPCSVGCDGRGRGPPASLPAACKDTDCPDSSAMFDAEKESNVGIISLSDEMSHFLSRSNDAVSEASETTFGFNNNTVWVFVGMALFAFCALVIGLFAGLSVGKAKRKQKFVEVSQSEEDI